MLPYVVKLNEGSSDVMIILGYLCGPNVFIKVIIMCVVPK